MNSFSENKLHGRKTNLEMKISLVEISLRDS